MAEKNIGWLVSSKEKEPYLISTRIRLARNLKKYPFPGGASKEKLENCRKEIFNVCNEISFLKGADFLPLEEYSLTDKKLLIERHLISHDHAVSPVGGVIIDKKEQISIMVNEEDHMRIQYISSGLDLFQAWRVISKLDDELSGSLDFAYSDKWGYLTSCPTNTGTGMRASCQMHLPGLGMTNGLKSTMENINKMGMVVRGLYGEGTKVMGNVLQISNQVTLGISEQRILDSLQRLVLQVVEREKKVCRKILENNKETLKDMIFRSIGVLSNAYKISFEEALNLISNVKFGGYMGMIDMDINELNNLMIKIQPAHIQELENNSLKASQRDIIRAKYIKQIIK